MFPVCFPQAWRKLENSEGATWTERSEASSVGDSSFQGMAMVNYCATVFKAHDYNMTHCILTLECKVTIITLQCTLNV